MESIAHASPLKVAPTKFPTTNRGRCDASRCTTFRTLEDAANGVKISLRVCGKQVYINWALVIPSTWSRCQPGTQLVKAIQYFVSSPSTGRHDDEVTQHKRASLRDELSPRQRSQNSKDGLCVCYAHLNTFLICSPTERLFPPRVG